jgi:hypothetical protein
MMIGSTSETAAARFLRIDLAAAPSHDLLAPPLTHHASTEASRRILAAKAFLRLRQGHVLPRVNLAAEPARGISPTADPA